MRNSITLTAPEVAAILAGATQVRVPIKPQPVGSSAWRQLGDLIHEWDKMCPYRVGSVLAVRCKADLCAKKNCRHSAKAHAKHYGCTQCQCKEFARLHLRVDAVCPEMHKGRWYWALRVERTEVGRG